MSPYNILTEWLAVTNASNLPLHLYTIPSQGEGTKHSMGGPLTYQLKQLNKTTSEIVFYEHFVASLSKIENWGNIQYLSYEHRPISLSSSLERGVLERLLKEALIVRSRETHVYDRDALRSKSVAPTPTNRLLIFPSVLYSFNVDTQGRIFVGFERKYRFQAKQTVLELLTLNKDSVLPKTPVTDFTRHRTYEYEFIGIASYTAGQPCKELNGESVIEYYQRTNQPHKLKNVTSESMVVLVKASNGEILPYLPQLLKVTCSYETLPTSLIQEANRIVKEETNEKMQSLIQEVFSTLDKHLGKLRFKTDNLLVESLGYKHTTLQAPKLRFGKNVTTQSIMNGLKQGGVMKGKSILVSFFVDPSLLTNQQTYAKAISLTKALQKESKKMGVELIVSSKPKNVRQQIPEDAFILETLPLHLKQIAPFFEGTVITICSKHTIQNSYKKIKKELGGKNDINTQFIVLEDCKEDPFFLTNILLGIYTKSGIQPWVLSEKLHSDCFIGLDVSHENGTHSTGVIQIVGNDGRLLKQKTLSTKEAGEKISNETLEEILYDCIHAYEQAHGTKPKHITFHRDGKCREDLECIRAITNALGVSFDYVEVIKNTNRRMASWENQAWKTIQGTCYMKDKEAFICATNPRKGMGMAKPVKFVQKTNSLPFDEIVSDLYYLSYMHIHCMQKTRLPITTHYADLSSTFHNQGLTHPASQHDYALPFV